MAIPFAIHGVILLLALQDGTSVPRPESVRNVVRALELPTNAGGDPVLRPDGSRILYGESASQARAVDRPSRGPSSTTSPRVLGTGVPTLVKAYASFGQGIGLGGIATANVAGRTEIYCGGSGVTFGSDNYWYALTRRATENNYDMVFVSPFYASAIVRLDSADVRSESGPEIVVLHADSTVDVLSAETKAVLGSFASTVANPAGMRFHDVDGDQLAEIFVVGPAGVAAQTGTGSPVWSTSGVGGTDVAIGQMDADASLEVATTDGNVVDYATGTGQCHWPAGFGFQLGLSDSDHDGMEELVFAEAWNFCWGFDVDTCLPKWSMPVFNVGAISVVDVDGNGEDELVVGDAQWGDVHAHSLANQQLLWSIDNPEHGTTWVTVADVDGAPGQEVLWGSGATSTGSDRLYVGDPVTRLIDWQNIQLEGPFVGPRLGDVDGDGRPDIVTASRSSDAGYRAGRILVLDADTFTVKAISQETMGGFSTGIRDLQLKNVDGDPALEIAIAGGSYDGVIQIYDFRPSEAFPLIWTNTTLPFGATFYSLAIGDTDGDGTLEVVGGVGREHTGALGIFTYIYDLATGDEEWHTLQMGSDYWGAIRDVALADTDNDGHVEIHAMVPEGTYVFDGQTQTLQAILGSALRSVETRAVTGTTLPFLWTGDDTGRLGAYRWNGTNYVSRGSRQLVPGGPLDSFTFGRGDSIYTASEGSLSFRRRFTDPSPQWTLTGWGAAFGRNVVRVNSTPMLVTTNDFAVLGFREP